MTKTESGHDVAMSVFAVARVTNGAVKLVGSAFAVAPNKFMTAAHVTKGDDSNLIIVLPDALGNGHYQREGNVSFYPLPVEIVAVDPIHDLCVLKAEDNVSLPHVTSFSSVDNVHVGQQLVSFGFPHADTGRLILTRRDLNVAAKVVIENATLDVKHAVLNVFARPGESGSPVFDTHGNVVAMIKGAYAPASAGRISIAGIDPTALHATTHAVSAEYFSGILS